MALSFVGAADNNAAPVVSAADSLVGLVTLLAWAAGGCNMLPDSVDLSRFWMGVGSVDDVPPTPGFFQMSAADLTELMREVGTAAGVSCKGLSPGSIPVYLGPIRKGQRPNYSGSVPKVPTSYIRETQTLLVRGMAFNPDDLGCLPAWCNSSGGYVWPGKG